MTRVMLINNHDEVSVVELFSALANIFDTRIYGLRGGLSLFPKALAGRLDVTLESPVELVINSGQGVEITLRDPSGASRTELADACVVACPLQAAVTLCPDQNKLLQPLSDCIDYTAAITATLAFKRRPDSNAMVVQIPSKESTDIALLFLEHNKVEGNSTTGYGIITADWESSASRRMMGVADKQIEQETADLVRRAFPELANTEIDFSHVTRWRLALPLTRPGVYQAIGRFNAQLDPRARIQFAADYMSAAGQNTAVTFGNRAAANLIEADAKPSKV